MKHAALYTKDGKIVTGRFHGEAYGKLSTCEKEQEIISGFFDSSTGQFSSEELNFFIKKIILIRHADVDEEDENPGITVKGRENSAKTANFIAETIEDIKEYQAYCSPLRRCVETSQIFTNRLGINFAIKSDFRDRRNDEPAEAFICRLKTALQTLSPKTIIISHCNLILKVVQLSAGVADHPIFDNGLPKNSISFVKDNNIIWFGKVV